jgi:hypothetical protein
MNPKIVYSALVGLAGGATVVAMNAFRYAVFPNSAYGELLAAGVTGILIGGTARWIKARGAGRKKTQLRRHLNRGAG